jgi:hypothetical protein
MGWIFYTDNQALTPDAMLKREFNCTSTCGTVWRVIDSATRGNVWYAILESVSPDTGTRYHGAVCLFKRSKKLNEFGYKDMGESSGPNAANAPLRIIDKLDKLRPIDPNDDSYVAKWARDWRQRCRDNAAKTKKRHTMSKGMIVKLGEHEYVLHSSAGTRRGWYVRMLNDHVTGSLYRASAKQLNNATIVQGVTPVQGV